MKKNIIETRIDDIRTNAKLMNNGPMFYNTHLYTPPSEKEMFDTLNPDNYEACYARAGFNDCLQKVKTLLDETTDEL